jgi:hypothetical protein
MHRDQYLPLSRRLRTLSISLVTVGAVLGSSGTGWAQQTQPNTPSLPTAPAASVAPLEPPTTEADLRVTLETLLQEHTYLAGNAIAPMIEGNQPAAQAAATVLDQNTQQLGALFGQLYGPETQGAFVPLWRRHITDYVVYAQAGLAGDATAQQQARQDLLQFAQDLDGFLSEATPTLPAGTIADGMTMHVQGTMQVIDALEAKDYSTAFNLAKQGADMTASLGEPLAAAIAQQLPEQFAAANAAEEQ